MSKEKIGTPIEQAIQDCDERIRRAAREQEHAEERVQKHEKTQKNLQVVRDTLKEHDALVKELEETRKKLANLKWASTFRSPVDLSRMHLHSGTGTIMAEPEIYTVIDQGRYDYLSSASKRFEKCDDDRVEAEKTVEDRDEALLLANEKIAQLQQQLAQLQQQLDSIKAAVSEIIVVDRSE